MTTGYLLVLEISLHATLFIQVQAVVAISIILSEDCLDLGISIATPTSSIITLLYYIIILFIIYYLQ